jgi:hypothetical protein
MRFPLQPVFNACCGKLFVVNFTTFVLRRFRAMLLAVHHFSREKKMFEIKQKSSTLLLETSIIIKCNGQSAILKTTRGERDIQAQHQFCNISLRTT